MCMYWHICVCVGTYVYVLAHMCMCWHICICVGRGHSSHMRTHMHAESRMDGRQIERGGGLYMSSTHISATHRLMCGRGTSTAGTCVDTYVSVCWHLSFSRRVTEIWMKCRARWLKLMCSHTDTYVPTHVPAVLVPLSSRCEKSKAKRDKYSWESERESGREWERERERARERER